MNPRREKNCSCSVLYSIEPAHYQCAFQLYNRAARETLCRVAPPPTVVPKRATNISIRSDLLAAAREAGVNLSATLERALTEELAATKRQKWREENRESIQIYNEHVEKHGTFSDDVRDF